MDTATRLDRYIDRQMNGMFTPEGIAHELAIGSDEALAGDFYELLTADAPAGFNTAAEAHDIAHADVLAAVARFRAAFPS